MKIPGLKPTNLIGQTGGGSPTVITYNTRIIPEGVPDTRVTPEGDTRVAAQ